jgi:hypothetical protein
MKIFLVLNAASAFVPHFYRGYVRKAFVFDALLNFFLISLLSYGLYYFCFYFRFKYISTRLLENKLKIVILLFLLIFLSFSHD